MVQTKNETKTELAWNWMCQRESFSVQEVINGVEINKQQIYRVINAWLYGGYIRLVSPKSQRRQRIYQVVDPAILPPLGSGSRPVNAEGVTIKRRYSKRHSKRKTVQQKLWNTMKISRRFTLADLMITANTNRNTAWHYTNQLVLAGYVRLVVRVHSRQSVQDKYGLTNIYQLVRDTGRFSPMRRDNGCWDQNQQRLYPFLVEEDEHGYVA